MTETVTMRNYTHPAIIDTLIRIAAPNPTPLQLFLARVLGTKRVVTDWNRLVVLYHWWGKYWITFNGTVKVEDCR